MGKAELTGINRIKAASLGNADLRMLQMSGYLSDTKSVTDKWCIDEIVKQDNIFLAVFLSKSV